MKLEIINQMEKQQRIHNSKNDDIGATGHFQPTFCFVMVLTYTFLK